MVKLIVAKAVNHVIGRNNDLIWHLPADLRFFSQTTRGHIVIMGRKNWESLPEKFRPLPDRINVVISRNPDFKPIDAQVYDTLESALDSFRESNKDIFIIGGGQIYDYALRKDLVQEMLITFVDAEFEGDTFFPQIQDSKWTKEFVLKQEPDEKNAWGFTIWRFVRQDQERDEK